MANTDWLPAAWLGKQADANGPFGALRKQIDSLIDDFDTGMLSKTDGFAVRSNLSETDKEICITAELPGIEMKDIDVEVTGNRISLKGEKKSENEEKGEEEGREFHRIERHSGSFFRSMTLPFDIDPDKVDAAVKSGVLTVTIPKPPEAVTKVKKVEVKSGD
ncbi:Hsp20/alpha crystallin family protein [uncultured Boseongicola sp.]|jgi:HSP20 family protein|uniref:Hsp20/alpha crystallin family protein n=1 Tax=uncultured Boseongicola sp. TaxID=1648499 RepID=UPI002606D55C|nr:Hsp20/alpha crystallin family protein [uncultured Boseongicola sp.]